MLDQFYNRKGWNFMWTLPSVKKGRLYVIGRKHTGEALNIVEFKRR